MKSLQILLVSLFFSFSAAFAQEVRKVVISTPTVQCDMCKKRIENYVSREEGVKSVVVDFKKKITTVTFLPERINIEEIKTAIANVGYDADNISAEIDTYNRLPKCCKKPVEKVKESKDSIPAAH